MGWQNYQKQKGLGYTNPMKFDNDCSMAKLLQRTLKQIPAKLQTWPTRICSKIIDLARFPADHAILRDRKAR
jgi:hypothetical protein